MAVLALVFWSGTALVGLYLLAIWLIEHDPDFRHAAVSRFPVLVITGHVLFAVAGLLSWVIYLTTGKAIYSWTSAGALAAIATLGFTMAIRWIGVPSLAADHRPGRSNATALWGVHADSVGNNAGSGASSP